MSRTPLPRGSIIGIVGNGPLGRMLAEAARATNYRVWIFGPGGGSPAGQAADREFAAEYDATDALAEFAAGVDIITTEFENVPHAALEFLGARKPVHPDPGVLALLRERLHELNWLKERGFPLPDFVWVRSRAELEDALDFIGTPALLSAVRAGPRQQVAIDTRTDPDAAWAALGAEEAVLEACVPSQARLSVACARSPDGDTRCFPVAQNHHRDDRLAMSRAPADLAPDLAQRAQALALQAAQSCRAVGIVNAELLLLPDGELLLEHLSPHPHVSAHFSIDACSSSQFQHHILAITNRPLPRIEQAEPATTVGLFGEFWRNGPPPLDALRQLPRATLHLYAKAEPDASARGRVGHLTVLGVLPLPLEASLTRLAFEQTFEPPKPPEPADRVAECLGRRPFLPFSVALADGRTLVVDESDALAPLRTAFVYQSRDGSVITFARDDIRSVT